LLGGVLEGVRGETTPAMRVNEIFHSIQGESTHAGRPCVFVRLTGCKLRCKWCDTAYAFHEGMDMTMTRWSPRSNPTAATSWN